MNKATPFAKRLRSNYNLKDWILAYRLTAPFSFHITHQAQLK
jgi:hypothetical protein